MKKAFAEDWKKEQEIRKAYRAAKEHDDEAGKKAARIAYEELDKSIAGKGKDYGRIYRAYREAQERGNDHIDLNEAIWDSEVEGLITTLRDYNVETFTFSSTWSGAVKTAWFFKENGCSLEGLMEINGGCRNMMDDGYERVPAYLFRVN